MYFLLALEMFLIEGEVYEQIMKNILMLLIITI